MLLQDSWCHIHSLMPLRDAAHSACLSHAFLRSWRCHPNLKFTEETLCLKRNACVGVARCFTMRVDQILKNHSGIGVKALHLKVPDSCKVDTCRLNRWLQIGITPGIEEVTVFLPINYRTKYSFPCSLLNAILAGAAQLPSCVWMQYAPSDWEQSSKPPHSGILWWPSTPQSWRIIAGEDPRFYAFI